MTLVTVPLLSCVVLIAVAALIAAAAAHDLIARTIPNQWCAAIACAGLLIRLLDHSFLVGIAAGAAVFILAAGCWRMGWLGGGDVKLLGACALAIPPHLVPSLVIDTSIAGALLALVYLVARRRVQRPRTPRPRRLLARAARVERWRLARGGPLPYAVAIAATTIVLLVRGVVS